MTGTTMAVTRMALEMSAFITVGIISRHAAAVHHGSCLLGTYMTVSSTQQPGTGTWRRPSAPGAPTPRGGRRTWARQRRANSRHRCAVDRPASGHAPATGPNLVRLEQDACPGDCLGRILARRIHLSGPSLFPGCSDGLRKLPAPWMPLPQHNLTPKDSIQDQTIKFVTIRLRPNARPERRGLSG